MNRSRPESAHAGRQGLGSLGHVSVLGHALLGLLSTGELTGYELTGEFDRSLANVWSAKHSQIYPELAKLQAAGLIRQTEAGPRGSKRYAATEAGRAEVRRWLAEPPAHEVLRSERILRVFFLWMQPPAEAARYLREQAAQHREKLARYESFAKLIPPQAEGPHRWSRISLEAGMRVERALAEWADWAATEAARPPAPR